MQLNLPRVSIDCPLCQRYQSRESNIISVSRK